MNTTKCRGVVPVGAGGAMAHPDFGRSVNPISTRGNRLCQTNYYWHTRIFRPSDGPAEEGHFPPPCPFGIRFLSAEFLSKHSNLFWR